MMRPLRLAVALLPALALGTAAFAQSATNDPWAPAPAETAPTETAPAETAPAQSGTARAWEETKETSRKVWGAASDKASDLWESTEESRESLGRDASRFGEDFLRDWNRVIRKVEQLTETE